MVPNPASESSPNEARPPLYVIANFKKHYLKHGLQKVDCPRWFPCQTTLSPEAVGLLSGHRRGTDHFTVWILMQMWAVRHKDRGGRFEQKSGQPMTVHEIAQTIGLGRHKVTTAESALARLVAIGWVTVARLSPDSRPTVGSENRLETALHNSTVQDREPSYEGSHGSHAEEPDPTLDPDRPASASESYKYRGEADEVFRRLPPQWQRGCKKFRDAWAVMRRDFPDGLVAGHREIATRLVEFYSRGYTDEDPVPWPATWIADRRYDEPRESWPVPRSAKPERVSTMAAARERVANLGKAK